MKTITVSLPDALAEFVEAETKAGNYASAGDWVCDLVREHRTKKTLDRQLFAAFEGEDLGETTTEFFERLRERVRDRAESRRRGGK